MTINLNKILKANYFSYIYIAILTVLTVLIQGYYYGTFDQTVHLPQLLHSFDKSYFPTDPFAQLGIYHYSYFWLPFKSMVDKSYFPFVLFIAYISTLYLTYYFLYRLAYFISANYHVALLTISVFMLPHFGFSGFQINDASMLNRTLALPFLILAIELYLRKKYLAVFIILGLATNIHVLYAFILSIMLGLDITYKLYKKQFSPKTLVLGIIAALICATPVLLWMLNSPPPIGSNNANWHYLVMSNLLHFIFYIFSTNSLVITLSIGGFSMLILAFVYIKVLKDPIRKTFFIFYIALILILIASALNTHLIQSAILTKFQILRAGVFLLIITYLASVNYYYHSYRNKTISKNIFIAMYISTILSIFPLTLLFSEIARRFIKFKYLAQLLIIINVLVFLIILGILYNLKIFQPGFVINRQDDNWVKTQLWAKDNTERSALFITPPHIYWIYTPTFRVHSQRGTVILLSDIMELAFHPHYEDEFTKRFNDLAPGAINNFNSDPYQAIELTKNAFYNLNEDDFIRFRNKYNSPYLVLENKEKTVNFPVIYRNFDYTVYNIPTR